MELDLAGAGVLAAPQDPPGRRLRLLGSQKFVRDIGLFVEDTGRVLQGLMRAPHVAQGCKAQARSQEAEKGNAQTQTDQIGEEAALGQDYSESQNSAQKEAQGKSGLVVGFPETAVLPDQICAGLDGYLQILPRLLGAK